MAEVMNDLSPSNGEVDEENGTYSIFILFFIISLLFAGIDLLKDILYLHV